MLRNVLKIILDVLTERPLALNSENCLLNVNLKINL